MHVKKTVEFSVSVDLEVEVKYTPGSPDVYYLPNGDPGYPGDSAEIEVVKVFCNGEELKGAIAEQIMEKLGEDQVYNELLELVEEEVEPAEIDFDDEEY